VQHWNNITKPSSQRECFGQKSCSETSAYVHPLPFSIFRAPVTLDT
jgi:hypothetical protein